MKKVIKEGNYGFYASALVCVVNVLCGENLLMLKELEF